MILLQSVWVNCIFTALFLHLIGWFLFFVRMHIFHLKVKHQFQYRCYYKVLDLIVFKLRYLFHKVVCLLFAHSNVQCYHLNFPRNHNICRYNSIKNGIVFLATVIQMCISFFLKFCGVMHEEKMISKSHIYKTRIIGGPLALTVTYVWDTLQWHLVRRNYICIWTGPS